MHHTDLSSKLKSEGIQFNKEVQGCQQDSAIGSNVPVYGHLVTADQLTQIERRKEILRVSQNEFSSKSSGGGPFSTTVDVQQFKDVIYANVSTKNEPMEYSFISGNIISGTAAEFSVSPHRHSGPPLSLSSSSSTTTTTTTQYSPKSTERKSDNGRPYYHYPDISYCQSACDKDKLYVNICSSNAQPTINTSTTTALLNSRCIAITKQSCFPSHVTTCQKSLESSSINMDTNISTECPKVNPRCSNPHTIVKLSVDLIKTYKNINEIYYRKKRRLKEPVDENFLKRDRKRNDSHNDGGGGDGGDINKTSQVVANRDGASQDNKGTDLTVENRNVVGIGNNNNSTAQTNNQRHPNVQNLVSDQAGYEYLIKPGEIWKAQYCIERLIGTGSFGQVVRAKDLKSGEFVAIKIIKNKRNFVEQAYIEISLLKEIGKFQETDEVAQQSGANYIVKLKSYFNHRGHLCLVFELLTYTLYELLKNTNFRGVSLNLTRKFAQQICQALVFLAKPQVQIIHCDLKPENILLLHPRRSAIKIVDFGSSCHANRRIYYYIQSRFYRSPEIILNLDYSHAIDMWSLGCIMAELHTGQPLFIGQFEHEQILRIIEVVGMPPLNMIDKGKKGLRYFERFSCNSSPNKYIYRPKIHREKDGKKISFQGVSSRKLSDIIGVYTGGPQGRRLNEPGHSPADYEKFLDLLQKMLIIDPSRRIKPDEALNHPFFIRSTVTEMNIISKSSVSHTSTSCDKTMISMAAVSKSGGFSRVATMSTDSSGDKSCGGNVSGVVVQTPQNQISTSVVESNLTTVSHPESKYLSLVTITTTAN